MNRFEKRWRDCVGRARSAEVSEAEVALPDGGRLLRRAARQARQNEVVEIEEWWRWYGARGLAVASVILAGCLLFAVKGPREVPSLRPGVEDAVAEVLWSL